MQEVLVRRLLLLALLVAVGCAKPLPSQPPLSVGPVQMSSSEWRVVDHVVVVTDASGTMYARRTFPEAKALAQSFVAAMPDAGARSESSAGYEAGLVGFGGSARITAPLAPFDRSALASVAQDLTILGSIDGMGGTTPLHAVLSQIQVALEGRRGPAAVVIFSDGLADSPEGTQRAAQSLIETYPDRVCIHTVHVGGDPKGADLLTRLSGMTECGSARTASSVQDITTFQRFAHTVFAGTAAALPAVSAPGPCEGIVRLRGVQFEFDRAEITPESRVVLDVGVDQLRGCKELAVDVIGHTDSVGTPAYNQGLSERRAESAQRYFIESGIADERLQTQGRGEEAPMASNDTAEGRAQNRRVELIPQR
jgi:OOP family OmpA-OmpF porin